jgi:cytochrome b6-f complex iron-sulfur subunit
MNDGAQKKQTPASSPRADGFQVVGSVADLDKTGELMVKDFVGGAVVVVRDPKNPNIVMAVSPTCTHQGCAVTWKADKKAYLCPCHGSGFSADGQVLTSPATRALKTFTAKLEGDSILVKG